MIGLIKKDLFTIKGNLKTILVIFFIFVLMAFQGMSDLSFILPLICIMMFMSTFSYDEFNNFNAYGITLPKGRENIVKSKYLATLILVLIASIITTIISFGVDYSKGSIDLEKTLVTFSSSIFAVILIESIMYPLIFKYGVEKGRIGLFAGIFIVTAILGVSLKMVDKKFLDLLINILNTYWCIAIPVLIVVMLSGSYLISKRIYLNKEF